jgi:addiction module RelE/StbE family toxin
MQIRRHKDFKKQYKKLPSKIKDKFNQRLILFLKNQFSSILNNHKLHGEWRGHRSINITGTYRAIYYETGDAIWFVAIDTHPQLYK